MIIGDSEYKLVSVYKTKQYTRVRAIEMIIFVSFQNYYGTE